jgi:hypothetical protein
MDEDGLPNPPRPIAAKCLAVLFNGMAIGPPLTGGTKIDIVHAA